MKLFPIKMLISMAAVFFVMLLSPKISAAVYMNDADNLYSDSQEAYLIDLMEEASEHTGWNYGIVTLHEDYNDSYSACRRAEQIYDDQFGIDSSGVLFMCDIGYRYFVIAGDARNYISGTRFNNMVNKIKDLYFDYEDLSCAITFIEYTTDYYDRGEGSFAIDPTGVVTGIIAAIIAAIICIVAVSSSYSNHAKPTTNNYLDNRKLDFYRRQDVFKREYTVRQSHSSSSGGGGGGGGHHGGGGFGGHR